MFRTRYHFALLLVFLVSVSVAFAAGKNVAIIDSGDGIPTTEGERWCQFLIENGHDCTLFPREGPKLPLDPFDVVIDMSGQWSDPSGTLADCMRAGKTVILVNSAADALGVDSNPIVQAWIGANVGAGGGGGLITIERDPILGDIPPGTMVTNCGASPCGALEDVSGHPFAKVLARLENGPAHIGIMRNYWEGGVSVYLTRYIIPGVTHDEIILNAVEARNTIPTLSHWGLMVLALAMSIAGTLIMRHRRLGRPGGGWEYHSSPTATGLLLLLTACLLPAGAGVHRNR